jgi:hypothetical protein
MRPKQSQRNGFLTIPGPITVRHPRIAQGGKGTRLLEIGGSLWTMPAATKQQLMGYPLDDDCYC